MSDTEVLNEILKTTKNLSGKIETIENSLQFTQAVLTTMLTDIELVKNQYDSIIGKSNSNSNSKKKIKTLRDLSQFNKPNIVKYGDGLRGFGLFKIPKVSVQIVHLDKGKKFPEHVHDSLEVGVIYEGKMELNHRGVKKIKSVTDIVIFQPGEPHSGAAIEDTEVIFISVPSDSGYPEGVFKPKLKSGE